jgi:histidinol-phosphatase
MKFEKELHFARSVAMHAGELALGYQTAELVQEAKEDLSPVTIADRECERLIARRIEEEFPDDGILGEEGSSKESKNGRRWIIDPIDGTRDFVRGLPLWSVLIGLEVDGEVVAGVSNLAPRREMYSALKGAGAWRNDSRLKISSIEKPGSALICVNGFNRLHEFAFADSILDWLAQFWAIRSMGGCVDAMMVASGHAELWLEPHAKEWDLAPLKIIAEEAGARFMNFDGGSTIYGKNGVIVVPALEGAVRELLGR